MTRRLRAYSCLQDMYETYTAPAEEIKFEKRLYRFNGSRRKSNQSIHLYHCAGEQHYIVVYLKFNLPALIKAFYSVDDVRMADL